MTDTDDRQASPAPPSALDNFGRLFPRGGRRPAVFLDYDGTLTPIVDRPDRATLGRPMRTILKGLAELCPVAVISGRDLPDIRRQVDIDALWYAGSHGFDIAGPPPRCRTFQRGQACLPALEAAERTLRTALAPVRGCTVERKRFSIAVHYRRAADADLASLRRMTNAVAASDPALRLSEGKKLLELQPAVDWHKGKALRWLMKALAVDPRTDRVIYLGDDTTDEDAFRELRDRGIGILVGPADRPTAASYRLDGPRQVEEFLDTLVRRLQRCQS